MRHTLTMAVLACGFSFTAPAAWAGHCDMNTSPACETPVKVIPGAQRHIDPVMMRSAMPMDHLRSVHFSGSRHVNVLRVHGVADPVSLEDAPSEFTKGCYPESSAYCRDKGAPVITPPLTAKPHVPAAPMPPRVTYLMPKPPVTVARPLLPRPYLGPTVPSRPVAMPYCATQAPTPTMPVCQSVKTHYVAPTPAPRPIMPAPVMKPAPLSWVQAPTGCGTTVKTTPTYCDRRADMSTGSHSFDNARYGFTRYGSVR